MQVATIFFRSRTDRCRATATATTAGQHVQPLRGAQLNMAGHAACPPDLASPPESPPLVVMPLCALFPPVAIIYTRVTPTQRHDLKLHHPLSSSLTRLNVLPLPTYPSWSSERLHINAHSLDARSACSFGLASSLESTRQRSLSISVPTEFDHFFVCVYMGSWVRTITTPFRKARTIFGPQKDGGKEPQQQSTAAMVQHGDAERAKLHGEVMACAYEDVQVMWSMLDQARIRDLSGSS